jgi:hypothetical protein
MEMHSEELAFDMKRIIGPENKKAHISVGFSI